VKIPSLAAMYSLLMKQDSQRMTYWISLTGTFGVKYPHLVQFTSATNTNSHLTFGMVLFELFCRPTHIASDNGIAYKHFWSTLRLLLDIWQNMWFMHDGALAHVSHSTRNYHETAYAGWKTGRYGGATWPSCSPDLKHLHFFFGDI
jgi:hypothetical protein